jgi:HAD superfamily hydrolase (TIGR01509 family)
VSLRAILFDMDGTMADTERLGHRPAYNNAFKEAGLNWRWGPKLYRRLLRQPGGGRDRLRHYLESYKPAMGPLSDAADDPDSLVSDLHARKAQHFDKLLRKGKVPLRAGVARLMDEAHAEGIRLAVVTNASRASLASMLQHSVGDVLRQRLDLVLCGDEGVAKKPAPDLYNTALQRLGIPAGDSVAIEDSQLGLQAAAAAGIPTLVTINDNTAGEDFSAAAMVVDTLGDPGTPATVFSGVIGNGEYVSLADLRGLCKRRR